MGKKSKKMDFILYGVSDCKSLVMCGADIEKRMRLLLAAVSVKYSHREVLRHVHVLRRDGRWCFEATNGRMLVRINVDGEQEFKESTGGSDLPDGVYEVRRLGNKNYLFVARGDLAYPDMDAAVPADGVAYVDVDFSGSVEVGYAEIIRQTGKIFLYSLLKNMFGKWGFFCNERGFLKMKNEYGDVVVVAPMFVSVGGG